MKKIYFLGPFGTYSEIAANKIKNDLNLDCDLIPISTISKIVENVSKEDSFGILPIENKIEGIVRPTLDAIYEKDVQIQYQIDINIEHCLFSKGNKKDIKHIISHPQALHQCQKYILNNFDENIELIDSSSTAMAIKEIISKDKTYSAIGVYKTGIDYNLNLIDKNIGDCTDNKTRFILISNTDLNLANKTRTSIMFNTKNESGALVRVLNIFQENNLNLVYIESRPSKKVFGEYNFFVDIDRGIDDIQFVLDKIKKECNYYKLLGSYPTE